MTDYTKTTDFAAKDALAPGNPAKVITGTAINTEFVDISAAIATKADTTTVDTALALKATLALAMPRIAAESTATTAARGKCSAATGGVTIPASVMAAGDAYAIYNDSAAAITLTSGGGLTLRLSGSTATGNRTLAARGMASVWFNSATEAIISGQGLS